MAFRDYQSDAIYATWDYWDRYREGHGLVAMPTASGKSWVIGGTIQSCLYYYNDTRIMCLTHVKELIKQNSANLLKMWPQAPMGVYSAGLKRRDYQNNIIFAGIASVYENAAMFGRIDILLIDEVHLVSPDSTTMYQRFIADLMRTNPKLRVVGYSATIWRTKQGMLTSGAGLFRDVIYDITSMDGYNRLVAQGWLTRLVPQPRGIEFDVSGVAVRGGEYVAKDLQKAVDQAHITRRALTEACRAAADRNHWLVFCAGIEHSEHTAQMLEDEFDIPCAVVHNATKDRDAQFARFFDSRVRALVGNNIFTTGFDAPFADVEIILRPTKSSNLWVQMLGRLTRTMYADGFDLETAEGRLAAIAAGPKPDGLVLDFAGNTRRLGPINDPLMPAPPGKRKTQQAAPVKICEHCGTYCHTSLRFCDHCGKEFALKIKIQEQSAGLEVMKFEEPRVELFDIERVTMHKHPGKNGRPPSLRVMYYSNGMSQRHQEFICFEHSGRARRVAEKWWMDRVPLGVQCPATVDEVLAVERWLTIPRKLRVHVNAKPRPEIIGYE